MAIGNVELMRECSPEYLRMGSVRLKWNKEIEEESKQKIVEMERSAAGTKYRSPVGLTVSRASRPPRVTTPFRINYTAKTTTIT